MKTKFNPRCKECKGSGIRYLYRTHKSGKFQIIFETFCPYCQEARWREAWGPIQERSQKEWEAALAECCPLDKDGKEITPLILEEATL